MSEVELAWAAGLFDGEGCIQIQKGKVIGKRKSPKYSLKVTLLMAQFHVVCLFMDIVGEGKIYKQKAPKGGVVWCWAAHAQKAKNALIKIMPYLKYKLPQAELGVTFQNSLISKKFKTLQQSVIDFREDVFKRMKSLKRVGMEAW